jgi:signal transduction histidine kinase/ligand-binding sensor domain-containing protein
MRYIFTIILFLFISTISSRALNYKFKHLDTKDGLSDNTVTSMFQDQKGFLWIGTRDGLNKYDGYTFQVFRKKSYDPTSISGNIITAICEDNDGNIWVGTQADGLSVYNTKTEKFKRYTRLANDSTSIPGIIIWTIVKDKNGNMWFGTENGLAAYNPVSDNFRRFRLAKSNEIEAEGNVNGFIVLPDGKFLLGYAKYGLVEFDPANSKFNPIQDEINKLTGRQTINNFEIVYSSDGTIWAGSEKNGLLRYNKKKKTAKIYISDINKPNSIGSDRIVSIIEDSRKNIWIACESGGFKNNKSDPYSISLNSLIAIYEDKFNNVWFGGYGGGLNYINLNQMIFKEYNHIVDDPTSLASNIVTGFCEDANKNIWITHEGGGVARCNKGSNTFKSYPLPKGNNGDILNDIEFLGNKLWVVGWGSGLHAFDPENGQFTKVLLKDKDNNLLTKNIKGLCLDGNGNLWVATHSNQGVFVYNPKTDKTFYKDNPGVYNAELLGEAIWNSEPLVDSKERIWIASYTGLYLWDGKFHSFKHQENDTSSIINDYLVTIVEDSKHNIWVATNGGLDLIKETDTNYFFEHYSQRYGLPTRINAICEDKNGILWLSSNNQIVKFNPVTHKQKYLNIHNGLTINSFFEKSAFCSSTGELYFGTYDGLIVFNPDSIKDNPYIPAVFITDFQIFNRTPKIGAPGSPLKQSVAATDIITIKYDQSVISFGYVGLNFIGAEEIQYSYMLEGFDKEWVKAGTERKATYTNLDPGNYTFRVKAANNDGVWNENGATLKLTITPPWWKTIVAIVSFFLAFIGLFLGFYFYRVNQLNEQKEKLEKLVKERTAEIEQKNLVLHKQSNELMEVNVLIEERQQHIEEQNEILVEQTEKLNESNALLEERQQYIEEQADELSIANEKLIKLNATKDKFFSIIAHDLKNPFTSILGFCEILSLRYDKMDDIKKKHLLDVVYESSKNLYKLLENLLEWARSQTGSIKYEPENFDINELIENNITLTENLVQNKNLQIKYISNGSIRIFADKNMISTVIRNLITNAIKFTESGGISIEVFQDQYNTRVNIIDTGIGISEDKLLKIFDVMSSKSTSGTSGESGTGLGLIICKEFIEKHGGTISVISEAEKGSIFSFTIPNNNSGNH